MLAGGNPRSLGRTEEVVELVLADRELVRELYDCLIEGDDTIKLRAGDALEKVARRQPQWLEPYVERLLTEVAAIPQASVQWHLAQLLGEVPLTAAERQRAIKHLWQQLRPETDWIVLHYTMDTLTGFAGVDPNLRRRLLPRLETFLDDRRKSIAKRAYKCLEIMTA